MNGRKDCLMKSGLDWKQGIVEGRISPGGKDKRKEVEEGGLKRGKKYEKEGRPGH